MKNTLSFNDSRARKFFLSIAFFSLLSELCLTLVLRKVAAEASHGSFSESPIYHGCSRELAEHRNPPALLTDDKKLGCIFPMVVRCHLSPSVDQFPTPPPSSRSQAQSPGSGTFLDRQQSKKERTMATWPTNKPFTVALLQDNLSTLRMSNLSISSFSELMS